MLRLLLIVLLAASSLYCIKLYAQEESSLKKRKNDYVLILNSHTYDDNWSTALSKQLRYEIEKRDPDVVVNIGYAGITHHTSFLSGRFGMQAAFANGRIEKSASIPSVLILIGDESWMYYRIMNLRGVWENVPVLLVGVKPDVMKDYSLFPPSRVLRDELMIPLESSKGRLPVTAIMDKENEAYTVWLMKQLLPDLTQVVFLSSNGYRDEYTHRMLEKSMAVQFPEMNLKVIHTNERKSGDLYTELSTLPQDAAILLGVGKVPEGLDRPIFQLNDRKLLGSVLGGYYPLKETYATEAADVVLRIRAGEHPDSIPFAYIGGEVPCLNETALAHFGLKRKAAKLTDVVYTNIPVPFVEKYMRFILLLSLAGVILIIIVLLNVREKYNRKSIINSMEKYKRIYDEYQIVYENMPMGLAFFDWNGNLLNRNESSSLFFDKVPAHELADFNLLQTALIDELSKNRIRKKILVNKVFDFADRSLRIILRHILDEESDSENILMIVLDYTDIQKEKAAKERIYDIFNFAMDASSLGVSEYNIMDKGRFATDAWYKNLGINKESAPADVYRAVIKEDREKLIHFLNHVGEDGEVYFEDTIRVKKGNKTHWLQYVIQLLEYGPDEGRIIVAELALNIDSQKNNEQELDRALQAAKESGRLKNAFIANMSSDIRPALNELVALSNRLIETDKAEEKELLMARIEQNNDKLLKYVERIIELSRTGTIKQDDL